MSVIDEVLAANHEHATQPPGPSEPATPGRHLLVVTCMDARVDPARALGLSHGDAHVLRNAGGRVTPDVLRSITLSTHLLGTREIMVVHHTRCGLQAPDDDQVRGQLRELLGEDVPDLPIESFSDLDDSVRKDVRRVRSWRYLPADAVVRGFVYAVETGRLREVDGD